MSELKDKAKELCNESGCHHKCPDTDKCIVEEEAELLINENKSNNFDVKSNEELFKQALVEGVNKHIDKTIEEEKQIEQIEEMIEIVKPFVSGLTCEEESGSCELTDCRNCNARNLSNKLYNAGYRKQNEGESINPIQEATEQKKKEDKENALGVLHDLLNEKDAEIKRLQNELVIWKQNRFNLYQRLELYKMAREKVASEIFEEIDLLSKIYTFPVVKAGVIEIEKEPFWCIDPNDFEKLKKKYTESDNSIVGTKWKFGEKISYEQPDLSDARYTKSE